MLVIAKYKEDISWSNGLDRKVYDKSNGIPNIGRESETYIRYILEHYDNLPNVISFCQGNPFDHVPNYLDVYKEIGFWGKDHITYHDSDPHHPTSLPVRAFAEKLDIILPDDWFFQAGANFTLSREIILKHNIDFYKKINKLINEYELAPWALERLWVHIFK